MYDPEDFTPIPPLPPTPGSDIANRVFYAAFERAVDMDSYAQLWAARHLIDPSQEDTVNVDEMLQIAKVLRDGDLDAESMIVYVNSEEDFNRLTVGHPGSAEKQSVDLPIGEDEEASDNVPIAKENDQ